MLTYPRLTSSGCSWDFHFFTFTPYLFIAVSFMSSEKNSIFRLTTTSSERRFRHQNLGGAEARLQGSGGVAGKGLQEQGYTKGLQEEGYRSRVTGRGCRSRVTGAGLQEGVAGRGCRKQFWGCRKQFWGCRKGGCVKPVTHATRSRNLFLAV